MTAPDQIAIDNYCFAGADNDVRGIELFLVRYGPAYIDATNKNGNTALIAAATAGAADTVKMLLEAGADIQARALEKGYTPLTAALWFFPAARAGRDKQERHLLVVKMLLDAGANAMAVADNGWSIRHFIHDPHYDDDVRSFLTTKLLRDHPETLMATERTIRLPETVRPRTMRNKGITP